MDYIAGSAVQTFDDAKEIFYSYDIACQWKIKLCEHMRKIPKHAQICDDMALDFGIPKLHCHLLCERNDRAICQLNRQASAHTIFTESLPQDKNWAEEWTGMVEKWEADYKALNPYFKEAKYMSEAVVKHCLKEKDQKACEVPGVVRLHITSPSSAVAMGLLIEETQRRIRVAYMPCVLLLVEEAPAKVEGADDVEHVTLWFPSTLTEEQRQLGCKGNIMKIEEDLQEVQCFDALDTIQGMSRTKQEHARTSPYDPCSHFHAAVAKYRVARAALLALQGADPWEKHLQVLQATDVGMMDGAVFCISLEETEDDMSRYQKRKKDTENTREGEGVEWLKSRARVHRWHEELALVQAEMQQCIRLLKYRARTWKSAHDKSKDVTMSSILLEEMKAYTDSQAAVNHALASSFQAVWLLPKCEVERPALDEREAMEREEEEERTVMGVISATCDGQIE
ncbi:hypothetical protein ARMGADRAFT_1038610 [Armillaria gallica]|uniref:Uncharacterized protein n=1 Tax=Armillaria gallica TaxID=47427 RepID=A0A2H3CTF4_ARMGA|nr:hypothetical protein ARMGADRAFT_1038610 [Armillaria gallica]